MNFVDSFTFNMVLFTAINILYRVTFEYIQSQYV